MIKGRDDLAFKIRINHGDGKRIIIFEIEDEIIENKIVIHDLLLMENSNSFNLQKAGKLELNNQ